MNSRNFDAALRAYEQGEYTEAFKGFYACLQNDSASFVAGDTGLVYYRLGNCLLKMRNFSEAAAVYQKSLLDPAYGDHAAVEVNLGKALIGAGDFEQSVEHFNKALADPTYSKPYQAQMGLGTAYSRLGMVIEAGTAYRNAALDDRNPNPAKALLNLGACFTLLNRPQDAVEAYNAIFEFNPTGATLFKAWENLGCAYVATGSFQDALDAFEEAMAAGKYSLSAAAEADYRRAQAAVRGAGGYAASAMDASDPFAPSNIYDDGAAYPELDLDMEADEGYGAGNVPAAGDTGFFTASDDAIIDMSKRQMKKERRLRHTGLKVLLVIVIMLVLLLGTAVFGYSQGHGYPSQEATVRDMFAAHAQGQDVSEYWAYSTEAEKKTIARIMDMVAKTEQLDVTYEKRDMSASELVVAAHLSKGGTIKYDIMMQRDLIGWKVTSIELIFDSATLP